MIIEDRELKPLVLNPPPNITRVQCTQTEDSLINFLENFLEHGFDIETTVTKDFFWRRIRTLQFGNNQEQYVIDLKDYCDNSDMLFNCQGDYGKRLYTASRLKKLLDRLHKYLISDKWVKVGVNVSFEYMCLYWSFGIRSFGYYDCVLAEKCIYAGLGGIASLKNYDFYSMESLMERYFGVSIDKTLQTSFNLEDDLSTEQEEYAALDTRTPLGIKAIQTLVASGETPASLKAKGKPKLANYLYYLDRLVLGDNLHEVIAIENEALGSFVDMHLHGERIDRENWLARVKKSKDRLLEVITELDKIFLPIVGSKLEAIDDATIANLKVEWETLRDTPTEDEIKLKLEISQLNRDIKKLIKQNLDTTDLIAQRAEADTQLNELQDARLEQKEIIKKHCGDLSKKRTKIKNLTETCEGEALINYGSDAQLMKCLKDNFKRLEKIENMDDDTLEKYESLPVMKLIREYHGLSKDIGTYGDQWATEWTTGPSKLEGWLHPGDGRLHCQFNQYDAGTGRSSSSAPNAQNLPADKEVRSCFIADPPNENIRISDCHQSDTSRELATGTYFCDACGLPCTHHAEEYVLITADMAGAELRIIADDANDPLWINAFAKDEDVHSVGTQLLYEQEWAKEALPDCAYFKPHTEESVSKNPKCVVGEPQKQKCECPLHKIRRGDNKSTNFLLAYGGGASKLANEIKKPLKVAKELMALHEMKNPRIWAYLKKSGEDAARDFKAFDLYGRRRILPEPTRERSIENCKEWNEKQLRLSPEEAEKNIAVFTQVKGRKPTQTELFDLEHRQPTADEISRSWFQISNSLTRQGKNHRIQGSNASIAKIAMAILWHLLPTYRAKLVKFVHDELVVQAPKQHAEKVAALIGDSFKKAAARRMHRVVMNFDFKISKHWEK